MANTETVTLGIRMPIELHERLTRFAKREHRSLNNQVIWMIENQLEVETDTIPSYQSSNSVESQSGVARASDIESPFSSLDWDPSSAGSIVLSTYWFWFWRPYLGIEAAALYEHLLMLATDDTNSDDLSMSMLEDALGVDQSTIFGANVDDSNADTLERESGLVGRLTEAGLVVAEKINDGWHFSIQRCIPTLTNVQVAALNNDLQHQHSDWLRRHTSDVILYM